MYIYISRILRMLFQVLGVSSRLKLLRQSLLRHIKQVKVITFGKSVLSDHRCLCGSSHLAFTCSKSTMETPAQCLKPDVLNVFLVSLQLTWDRFYLFFWCFHCWLWTSKHQLVFKDEIRKIFFLVIKREIF